jgi:3-isopropylmalate/(R)-2-methylmalate dehydratase small subunit
VLNDARYSGEILVTGKNFGCGSSREHAAWAVKDYGFHAVVSSSFADIFKNNALNNFLLPVQVEPDVLASLFEGIFNHPALLMIIDVKDQLFEVPDMNIRVHFAIDPYKKECFMNGYDDIEYLLSLKEDIEVFEKNHPIV